MHQQQFLVLETLAYQPNDLILLELSTLPINEKKIMLTLTLIKLNFYTNSSNKKIKIKLDKSIGDKKCSEKN